MFYLLIYRFLITEAEHGYASTMPIPDDMRTITKRPKTKKSQGSRFVSIKISFYETTHRNLHKFLEN